MPNDFNAWVLAQQQQQQNPGLTTEDMLRAQEIPVDPAQLPPNAYLEVMQRTRGAAPGEAQQQMINLAEKYQAKQAEAQNLQELGQRQMEQQFKQYQQMEPPADLSGLAALADAWGTDKSNFSQIYQRPESAQQRAEKMMALQEKLQQRRADISKSQAESLKSQIDAYKAAREKPLEEQLIRAKIGALGALTKERMTGEKDIKADQALAAGFGRRMQQAEQVFDQLYGKGYDRASRMESAKTLLPGEMQPENLRLQSQAEQNFVNATLRRESGAAISKDEFTKAESQYFPRPGDTPAVLAQKQANRRQAIESMKVGAGRAWAKTPLISPQPVEGQDMSIEEKIRRYQELTTKDGGL